MDFSRLWQTSKSPSIRNTEIVHCSSCTLLPPREGLARGSPAGFKGIEFFAAVNLSMEPIRLLEVELKLTVSGLY
jgi:hypothetical protein